MLTRSVVACMLSGTLVSGLLLGGPLVTDVHARRIAVKKATKPSRAQQGTRKAAVPTPREQQPASPSNSQQGTVSAPAQSRPGSLLRTKTQSVPAKHLGTFTVRAYTHYHRPGTKPSKTAAGTVPVAGRTVAVDPRVIPLGTRIHIDGLGVRIAEDTGGKIKGKSLDLFLPSVRECRKFGVQAQEVHVIAD